MGTSRKPRVERVELACERKACGIAFRVLPSKVKRFCSVACMHKQRAEETRTWVRTCKVCNEEFTSTAFNTMYCPCADLTHPARQSREERRCERCDAPFETTLKGKTTARYCSKSCAQLHRAERSTPEERKRGEVVERVELTCEWEECDETFLVMPKKPKRFCSRSCSAKWRNTLPEIKAQSRAAIKIAHEKNRGTKRPDIAERMRKNNPMANPEAVEKMRASNQGRTFLSRGGNGQPTTPQLLLAAALGDAPIEHPILTAAVKDDFPSLPHSYKVDVALVEAKLAIEVDGNSHKSKKWKFLDRRKTEVLEALGWTVVRYWNEEVLADVDGVAAAVQARAAELLAVGLRPAPDAP